MNKPCGNRICQAIGHEWAATTVTANYRRCVREQCGMVERHVENQWVPVSRQYPSRQQPTSAQPPLFTPERLFPSSEEERRAERAYRLILGQ